MRTTRARCPVRRRRKPAWTTARPRDGRCSCAPGARERTDATAGEIVASPAASPSSVNYHMDNLEAAGRVDRVRDGSRVRVQLL